MQKFIDRWFKYIENEGIQKFIDRWIKYENESIQKFIDRWIKYIKNEGDFLKINNCTYFLKLFQLFLVLFCFLRYLCVAFSYISTACIYNSCLPCISAARALFLVAIYLWFLSFISTAVSLWLLSYFILIVNVVLPDISNALVSLDLFFYNTDIYLCFLTFISAGVSYFNCSVNVVLIFLIFQLHLSH